MIQKLIPQRYELFSGDTGVFNVAVKDQDEAAQDITGATARFVVSRRAGDASPVIDLDTDAGITISDATNGLLTVTIPASDTEPLHGAYRWELEITDVAGRVSTVAFGTITFNHNTA